MKISGNGHRAAASAAQIRVRSQQRNYQPPPPSAHPLKRLLYYGRAYRRWMGLASLCSVLNKLFDLAPPVLIGAAVDVVVQQEDSLLARWGVTDVAGQLLILSILTLIVWGLESIFQYAYEWLWRNLAQTMQHDLRLDAYSHMQDLDLAYFESNSTGSLMAVLNDDVNQLEWFLDRGANDILQVTTTVIIIGAAFFTLAPSVAWMAMLPMPYAESSRASRTMRSITALTKGQ